MTYLSLSIFEIAGNKTPTQICHRKSKGKASELWHVLEDGGPANVEQLTFLVSRYCFENRMNVLVKKTGTILHSKTPAWKAAAESMKCPWYDRTNSRWVFASLECCFSSCIIKVQTQDCFRINDGTCKSTLRWYVVWASNEFQLICFNVILVSLAHLFVYNLLVARVLCGTCALFRTKPHSWVEITKAPLSWLRFGSNRIPDRVVFSSIPRLRGFFWARGPGTVSGLST